MEPAKVYFSDLHTDEISTLEKLHRLMKAAGFEQIDFKDKYVAIKLHFGALFFQQKTNPSCSVR